MAILDLANPVRFLSLSARILPWIAAAAVVTLAIGFTLAFQAPPDYQQGETVRIMYIHVPFAWLGLFGYSMMAASSIGILVWRHPLADVAHKAAAPVGATFTALCLVTGALWGRPMWGTYWVWDARLTSMLVLLLLYLGLMALRAAIDDPNRAGRAAAVLTLVGFINVPIVKFSVDWWNTLHQPASVFRMGGSTIDSSLLWPLLICAIGFTLVFIALHMLGMRTEILRRRVQALEARAAAEAMA
ncbi:MAG: heme ABC transporter permease [Rhizobiales bacterium]|uniref:heme ABC transporter permease n=1 Tax=Xanthobacter sp. SG618 TaxID=2587121 RepID=UPI00145C8EBA|nr:heme ABC transporter permease [Xanthobacter sp. SG618]MBN8916193.1 heme ABC transporter permease [Hyphomicrobiales bacterium]NMN56242.1 heme exporter protein C [Xanthobacter sp. SG618]